MMLIHSQLATNARRKRNISCRSMRHHDYWDARYWWSIIITIMLLACTAAHAEAPIMTLSASEERTPIGQWLDILTDDGQTLTPSDLVTDNSHFSWQRYPHKRLSLGLVSHPVWLRLRIDNPGHNSERVLELSRATLGHIGLYTQGADGRWQWREAGADALSPRGDMESIGYSFKLLLPHGRSTHILRLESSYTLSTPIYLSHFNATLHASQESAAWFGWGLGAMTGLIFVILIRPPKVYSWTLSTSLVLLQLATILFALADRGVLGNWWLQLPGVQHGVLQVSIMLLQMALLWFGLSLLQARQALSDIGHKLLISLLAVEAAALMIGLVIEQHAGIFVLGVFPLITPIALCLACYTGWRKKAPGIWPLLVCFMSLCILRLVIVVIMLGWLELYLEPYQFIMTWQLVCTPLLLYALREAERHADSNALSHTNSPLQQPRPSKRLNAKRQNFPALRAYRILVVEDNIWVQQVTMGLLKKLGHVVLVASNGQEALQLMIEERLDLVLMDCDLPLLDGVTATQIWRQRELLNLQQSPLPIVAITAHVSEELRQLALQAGMNDFLAKPVDLRKLRETILRWVSTKGD